MMILRVCASLTGKMRLPLPKMGIQEAEQGWAGHNKFCFTKFEVEAPIRHSVENASNLDIGWEVQTNPEDKRFSWSQLSNQPYQEMEVVDAKC